MIRRAAVVLFACALAARGDDQRFASLGDFKLESGETIRTCRIGYRVAGELNAARSNAIVVTTWFGGRSGDLQSSIGPGKLFDTSKHFVITIDALGDAVSSSPSNSSEQPGEMFPHFTMRDMVRSQHELLVRELKLDHVYAVSGLSMGGMQAFQWLLSYPEFMDKAVPIVGTPRQTSNDILLWQTQLDLLESFDASPKAMRIIAGINAMELRTPSWIVKNVPSAPAMLETHRKSLERIDPFDYMSQLRAMIGHDVYRDFDGSPERAAKAIKARLLVVVALQDEMVNPEPARELARVAGARVVTLTGDCGHLASACEAEVMRREVARFLD